MKSKHEKELEAENKALNARIFWLESPVKQMLDMSGYAIAFIKAVVPIIENYEAWGEKVMKALETARAQNIAWLTPYVKVGGFEADESDPCTNPAGHESQPGTDKCKHCPATYQVNYGWHVGEYPRTIPINFIQELVSKDPCYLCVGVTFCVVERCQRRKDGLYCRSRGWYENVVKKDDPCPKCTLDTTCLVPRKPKKLPEYITEDTAIPDPRGHNYLEARLHVVGGNAKLPGEVGLILGIEHADKPMGFVMVGMGKPADDVILREANECWINYTTGEIHFHDMGDFEAIVKYIPYEARP